jgi:hypothetical protein
VAGIWDGKVSNEHFDSIAMVRRVKYAIIALAVPIRVPKRPNIKARRSSGDTGDKSVDEAGARDKGVRTR